MGGVKDLENVSTIFFFFVYDLKKSVYDFLCVYDFWVCTIATVIVYEFWMSTIGSVKIWHTQFSASQAKNEKI